VEMCYGLDILGSIPGRGNFILPSTAFISYLGPTQFSMQLAQCVLSPGVKRPECEDDQLPHLVLRSKMVELYVHSRISVDDIVFN
jgi:hypothetical protein